MILNVEYKKYKWLRRFVNAKYMNEVHENMVVFQRSFEFSNIKYVLIV